MKGRIPPRSARTAGFTLIEALTSMVVMAFGVLALSRMHLTGAAYGEVARQHAQATHRAQACLEALRSFRSTSEATSPERDPARSLPDSAEVVNEDEQNDQGRSTREACRYGSWTTLASGSDRVAAFVGAGRGSLPFPGNTVFERTWSLAGSPADALRAARVTVAWSDRQGKARSVDLQTLLVRADPADTGAVLFPLPSVARIRRPLGRHPGVPPEALDLGQGQSALAWSVGRSIVQDNATGEVVATCTGPLPSALEGSTLPPAGCTAFQGILVTGFITGAVTPMGGSPTVPSGLNAQGLVGPEGERLEGVACWLRTATDPATGVPLAAALRFACTVPLPPGGAWSGTLRLGGISTQRQFKVCRPASESRAVVTTAPGSRWLDPGVGGSRDNENFFLDASGEAECPSVGGAPWTVHQDCRMQAVNPPSTAADGACPLAIHDAPT